MGTGGLVNPTLIKRVVGLVNNCCGPWSWLAIGGVAERKQGISFASFVLGKLLWALKVRGVLAIFALTSYSLLIYFLVLFFFCKARHRVFNESRLLTCGRGQRTGGLKEQLKQNLSLLSHF